MTIDVNNLKNEILELIDSHKEGVYWDFKEKWYEKNYTQDLKQFLN